MGWDQAEGPDLLASYIRANQYPWDAYLGNQELFSTYKVLIQATKIGINRKGVISYRSGYGVQSAQRWEEVLRQLMEDR